MNSFINYIYSMENLKQPFDDFTMQQCWGDIEASLQKKRRLTGADLACDIRVPLGLDDRLRVIHFFAQEWRLDKRLIGFTTYYSLNT